ncbi:hypothetical protein [Flavobacterium branchiophilum]|uniref:Uncharacterized protein n=1 Tax=Flavobacterium branchiophilum TaxID=55197 RepID=A0A2H3KU65_9FLAO|nr:hypothetical protein [Flavobacterium branchiophilum]PDS23680.1 hypothetical protein B0A77_10295 [Flavobacterium branchiophilum]
MLSAQELLSKEEKARREKNIQAGNPFAKYGISEKNYNHYIQSQSLTNPAYTVPPFANQNTWD